MGAACLGGLALSGQARPDLAVLGAVITLGLVIIEAAMGAVRAASEPSAAPVAGPSSPAAPSAPPLAAMIEALPDPLLVVEGLEADDQIGRRYMFANSAARDLLKLPREDGLLVRAVRDPAVLEAVNEALVEGEPRDTRYEIGVAQERVLSVHVRPLPRGERGQMRALVLFRDETESRRLDRTRVDFLANASHELRSPLASLTGFIETLRGHARDDAGARERFLAIMQTQAERMSRLVDDLMSLSRIELSEHVAPREQVDLVGVVRDVVDASGPIAARRAVRLQPGVPDHPVVIAGERHQLVQVVQNLVDNAVKYSPQGGVVELRLRPGLPPEAAAAGERRAGAARLGLLTPDHGPSLYAALSVSDAGAGMAREHLPRLTERFYRVEGQKSGDREGTGLGLAIVKHIINRHRGGLVVESAPQAGTTFTAYFPHLTDESPSRID